MTKRIDPADDLGRVVTHRPKLPKRKSPIVRFMEKVQIQPDGCWLWQGEISSNGRPGFRHPETKWAHRAAYLMLVGPIPDGLTIDHLCYVPTCVNPDHLDVVTQSENTKRYFQGWTTCDKFHPGVPTRIAVKRTAGREREYCGECHKIRGREDKRRRLAAMAAPIESHEGTG